MKSLLTEAVYAYLNSVAPLSHAGESLTISQGLADQKNPESITLSYCNCMESDWWVGAQDGVYTRQIRIPISLDQISDAAVATGMDRGAVEMILMPRRISDDAAAKAGAEYSARLEAEQNQVIAEAREKFNGAAVDEKREMLFTRLVNERQLHGSKNKMRRKSLRNSLAKKSLAELESI